VARVWFVRRRGAQWIAPGGTPACERPLAELIFPLDLGQHRRVDGERVEPAAELPAEDPAALHKVFVEVEPRDLGALEFTGFAPGLYDSPYSPRAAAARLAAPPRRASA
jgi:hypothetical protein